MTSQESNNPVAVEREALSKVHQFFDDVEKSVEIIFGRLSSDSKELFAKLRGQVHSDVVAASDQLKQDIAAGKTDVASPATGTTP